MEDVRTFDWKYPRKGAQLPSKEGVKCQESKISRFFTARENKALALFKDFTHSVPGVLKTPLIFEKPL